MAWAPSYCTAAELASFMRIGDTLDSAVMTPAISASSRAIDRACDRQFGTTTAVEDRYYEGYLNTVNSKWNISADDINSATGLLLHWDSANDNTFATAITDYTLTPRNSAANAQPWTHVLINAGVVGTRWYPMSFRLRAIFGWTAVPEAIKYATLLQASRLVSRRDAPFGITGSMETGGELRVLSKLDADVSVLVKSFRRVWGVQ